MSGAIFVNKVVIWISWFTAKENSAKKKMWGPRHCLVLPRLLVLTPFFLNICFCAKKRKRKHPVHFLLFCSELSVIWHKPWEGYLLGNFYCWYKVILKSPVIWLYMWTCSTCVHVGEQSNFASLSIYKWILPWTLDFYMDEHHPELPQPFDNTPVWSLSWL